MITIYKMQSKGAEGNIVDCNYWYIISGWTEIFNWAKNFDT